MRCRAHYIPLFILETLSFWCSLALWIANDCYRRVADLRKEQPHRLLCAVSGHDAAARMVMFDRQAIGPIEAIMGQLQSEPLPGYRR